MYKFNKQTDSNAENATRARNKNKASFFRLSPVVTGNMRQSVKDMVIQNYRIPKGVS